MMMMMMIAYIEKNDFDCLFLLLNTNVLCLIHLNIGSVCVWTTNTNIFFSIN